ncbi:type VII secretion integral membrane protein EccD [Streptacidiphilus sp. ASG 303]|uniref:type VII secretion integral membrane protein EccD n=1 Tax=Streptacidiphilus sp. ASG 303 TaxID=2896847 RepID=UPI001E4931AA|nr:type VII secretion integral membrane protein EccD [Streptacidiphilus sp. ASG 303]MCD0484109.1 type VII secretion integral membrane protein EccD [Streptacidiphilus sp. ASG 303]
MTTSPPTVPTPAPEVCRITVDGPAGRADVAVPVSTPVSALLPVLVRHVTAGGADAGTPWVLQRLGEDPLDADGTPESLGLRHGDVLYLRPAEDRLAPLEFDDVADGVAHVISGLSDRWRPELTGRLALSMACLALGALAAAVLEAGPGPLAVAACGTTALVLAFACVAGARLGAGSGPGSGSLIAAGVGAMVFAGLMGAAQEHAADGGFALGVPTVPAAAGYVAVTAGTLLALGPLPLVVPATVLVTAAASVLWAALEGLAHWDAARAGSVAVVALFVLGHLAPRLALRMARLRAPQLPRDAEELQRDIEPATEERVSSGVSAANAYLNTLSLASGPVYAAALWFVVHEGGWIGWVLPLVLSAALLLRARGLTGTLQRAPHLVAGALGVALALVVHGAHGGTAARTAVLAVLLTSSVLLLVGAWRLPTARLLPVWGHTGDILEVVAATVLLPLVLQELHVYAYVRSLAG